MTPTTRKRVLFVDDERDILDGIADLLRPKRKVWELLFATSGAEALAELERCPCDVVVADMRMPHMGGDALLQLVRDRYPQTARIILSGHAEREALLRAVPVAQQLLTKPCEAGVISTVVERSVGLQELLADEPLRLLIGGLERLPSVPAAYFELTRAIGDARSSVTDVASIVETDPAMSVKVLQLANSAFFSRSAGATSSISRAVALLGLTVIRGLALGAQVFGGAVASGVAPKLVEQLQSQAIAVARCCRRLRPAGREADEAFTCGLLLDMGRLILEVVTPKPSSGHPSKASEGSAVGHGAVGAYVLGLWGLPLSIVEAVAFHHQPGRVLVGSRELLAAAHVSATLLEAPTFEAGEAALDHRFLAEAGVAPLLPEWFAKASEERRLLRGEA